MRWLLLIIPIILFLSGSPIIKPEIVGKVDTLYVVKDTTIYKSVYEIQPNKNYSVPDINTIKNMDLIANKIYEPLRKKFGDKLINKETTSSFYRNWDWYSQHTLGLAIDINTDSGTINRAIYEFIRDSLDYDQLIIYGNVLLPSHVHASKNPEKERLDIKRAFRWKGKWYYREYETAYER